MNLSEPHALYITLTLPTVFAAILIFEGLNQVLSHKTIGWVSAFFGFAFLVTVWLTYFALSG
ncbi:hypothetical protein A3A66_03355 [Microgenomates group bacterium RIFCSPLOWO2_01_FULL_46_13]|nr:MAG: hypothetical protein A2783_04530 [Microgenomates group bacterium RIFCSPHIGHO2_01_FULL_45_11]OGV95030.1 MAG: hypothetical protein A3A66_03355 [Microgenomates group bacterium RIFCSPLOWO2_01_FULL_46_13]